MHKTPLSVHDLKLPLGLLSFSVLDEMLRVLVGKLYPHSQVFLATGHFKKKKFQ
jgi:hypothetical protein